MIDHIDPANILFLDIETVSEKATYQDLSDPFKQLWLKKSQHILRKTSEEMESDEAAALYPERAAIFAEFGKIVCISVGAMYRDKDKQLKVRLKSFADENEANLLQAFSELVTNHYNNINKYFFCGHNIKEFDIPYLCRRLLVNQLPFPESLNLSGKKPWETKHLLDTMELWKFGDKKNFTSLNVLAAVLDFPSPKDDMDGSNVGRVFWEEQDLERIAHYCEKDVLATIQLFLRYRRLPLLKDEQVIHVSEYQP